MLVTAERSLLLLVDVQERLAPAVAGADACVERCRRLIQAALLLDVPILATEQYPSGLGHLLPALADLLEPERVFAKTSFSAAAEPAIAAALAALGRDQVVVCGMEAHVCVLQTALGLGDGGYLPVVAADAVASRDPANRDLGLARLGANGVEIASSEMVMFEWLGRAGNPRFRAVLPLIK